MTRFLEIRCNPWKGGEDIIQVELAMNFINTLRYHEIRFTNHRRRRGEMKKFIVLCLAGLLILAFGAPGYAQAPKLEFKASGFLDIQTFLMENVPQRNTSAGLYRVVNPNYASTAVPGTFGFSSPGWNKTDSHWDARANLKFDAIMGPNLSGTIYFEIDTYRWGTVLNGSASTREANAFGAWTTDRTSVEVKNVYIDFGLPYFGIPVPVTVRVGAQPIGVRPNMFVYSDGTGVTAGIKIDPVMIIPIYAKALENLDFADDDVDVWGLHVNAKLGTFTVGGYGLNYRMNTYPFFVNGATIVAPTFGGTQGAMTGILNTTPGTFKSHMWWFGAYADGKAGPVNLNFDFVCDYGSVDERQSSIRGLHNVNYRGWATRLKVDYPWEKFNFGGTFMYASGTNALHSSNTGLPGSTSSRGTYSSYVSGYVGPPGAEQDTANNESIVVYGMENGASGGIGIAKNVNNAAMSRSGFGGTWFAKLSGSVKATPWYKLTLQGLYIGDTTENGNTFGNAVKYKGPTGVGAGLLRNDTNIGWEFDLINEIQIYNNLKFIVGAGYLIAGDALDINMNGTGINRAAANPWAVRTRLMYTF